MARMTGEGCVAQRVSEGEGPLSQIQFPPEGRCSARKPQAGTPLPRPVPTQRGPPWDGSVPSALHPPPGRRALRACPGPQACSLGLATLGTSRACWAFLLGLGPSAETLVLLCILSPPGPRGEASQGLLRSGLPSVQLSAKGPSGLPGGPGVPARLSLPEHAEAVGPLPLPLIPGQAGGRPGPAPTGSPEEDTLLGDWLWSPIPAPHIFGLAKTTSKPHPPPPPCHQAGSHPNRCQEGKLRPEKGCWASSSSRAPPDPSWLTRGLGGHDTHTASQKKLGDRLGHWPGRPTCLPGKVPLGTGQAPHPRSRLEPRPRALQGSSGGPELGWELGARSWGGLPAQEEQRG